jgi:homoserine O-acetyltransferase
MHFSALRGTVAAVLLAVLATLRPLCAQTVPDDHLLFAEGDLPLEGGGAIQDFAISYVTHGTLNKAKSNAILMTSPLGGNHHRIDFLIGPGKPFDTAKYFVICTDAIGNGLSTSPSNSVSQHGTAFPHFGLRDNITAQKRLLDHFGIKHLVAVTGASMGGMQSLQWAVSYPTIMDAVIAITPLAKTPAWSVVVMETMNHAIEADPVFNNGNYTQEPLVGLRTAWDILLGIVTRTPDGVDTKLPVPLDAIAWLKSWEDKQQAVNFDANNWMYQSYAYERFDVSTTPGVAAPGDLAKTLGAVKAKVIIMHDKLDLLNPTSESREAAALIPGAQFVENPSAPPSGHFSASAQSPEDVDFMVRTVSAFLAQNNL